MKLIFDYEIDCVIGVGIVGLNVGDFIVEVVLVIEMVLDVIDLGYMIYLYLILLEMVNFVVEMFEGMIIDLMFLKKCK